MDDEGPKINNEMDIAHIMNMLESNMISEEIRLRALRSLRNLSTSEEEL